MEIKKSVGYSLTEPGSGFCRPEYKSVIIASPCEDVDDIVYHQTVVGNAADYIHRGVIFFLFVSQFPMVLLKRKVNTIPRYNQIRRQRFQGCRIKFS